MSSGIMKVCHVYQLKQAHNTRTYTATIYGTQYIEDTRIYLVYMPEVLFMRSGIFSRARVEFIRKQDADSLSILARTLRPIQLVFFIVN